MERTLISWNVPNLITIPLMAFLGFLIFGLLWQVIMQWSSQGAAPATDGGY